MRRHRPTVELPTPEQGPLQRIGVRVAVAVTLTLLVTLITYVGRDGYVDPEDDTVSLLDALYYATVSITTTGYGDIRPVTDGTRLATTLLVTPARVLFLIILVGTTLEILAGASREALRRDRWRKRLRDHVIICGYGTKGRVAARTLLQKGCRPDELVVLDPDPAARERATRAGMAAVAADGTSLEALKEAGVGEARSIVVAVSRDDTAVLITLTARECNPRATIVAAVREEENVHLLHQSGATSVVTSASAAGRLLGHAVDEPRVTEVLEDLLSVGEGLDIAQRRVAVDDAGPVADLRLAGPIIGVLRGERLLRFDDPEAARVQAGDRVVHLRSHAR